ncbi:MAG: hypothetical protein EP314_06095 [Bacteroidetes bacterium]|nr:MAG: hypothetical protein EP314_06095 [Bacteroidota bacterium]
MSTTNAEKRASLVNDLLSDNETIALAAIEKVKKTGDASLVPAILRALASAKDLTIENALSQLLFDLKDKEAIEELVNQLSNSEFASIRVIMLSACWQTGMDLSHRLPDLITIACTGNYMECLEVLTVIENWEQITDKEMLENETIRLRSYLSESDTPENDDMIFSILEVMEKFAQ